MAKVGHLKLSHQEIEAEGKMDLCVEFEDPIAIKNIFSQLDSAVCVYTIEVSPTLPSVSILLKHTATICNLQFAISGFEHARFEIHGTKTVEF